MERTQEETAALTRAFLRDYSALLDLQIQRYKYIGGLRLLSPSEALEYHSCCANKEKLHTAFPDLVAKVEFISPPACIDKIPHTPTKILIPKKDPRNFNKNYPKYIPRRPLEQSSCYISH